MLCALKIVFDKINFLNKRHSMNELVFQLVVFWRKMAGKIKYNTDLENIYIGPNPGDAGGAKGSALYVHNKIQKIYQKWIKP